MGRAYISVLGTVAVVLFGYLGYRRGQKELLSRYGKLDKDGRYVYHADGTLDVEQALQEDYDREFKELMDTCITIPCEKISIDSLERNGIRLSPIEVITIEGLLME